MAMSYSHNQQELNQLCEYLWDADFEVDCKTVSILPESENNIVVVYDGKEIIVKSFDELIELKLDGVTLPKLMENVEVRYAK